MTPVLEKSAHSQDSPSAEPAPSGGSGEASREGTGPSTPEPGFPARGAIRLAAWAACTVGSVGGLCVWLFMLRDHHLLEEPAVLHGGWLILAGITLAFWLLLVTTPPYAIKLDRRLSKRLILCLAALPIGTALWWIAPVLSVEPLGQRLDARTWLLGGSPYVTTAAEMRRQGAREPELQPDLLDAAATAHETGTLHLPVLQAAAVASRALEYQFAPPTGRPQRVPQGGAAADWRSFLAEAPPTGRLLFWRLILAVALLLTVGELIAWLRASGRSPWWAVCFAWHPLVIVETVGMGHAEVAGILFVVAGLRRVDGGCFRRAALCLAAAAAVKPIALLAIPFVFRSAIGESRTSGRRFLVWFVVTLGLLSTPLWITGGGPRLTQAIEIWFFDAERTPSLYRLLDNAFLGPEATEERHVRVRIAAWILVALGTLLAGAAAWAKKARPATAFYVVSLTALLLSPVSPPWTAMWPLAMVPLSGGRFGLTALVWSATATLLYDDNWLAGIRTSAATAWLVYGPVVATAMAEVIVAVIARGRPTTPVPLPRPSQTTTPAPA